jgi:hypothetical protein
VHVAALDCEHRGVEPAAEGDLADGAADDVSALLHGSLQPKEDEDQVTSCLVRVKRRMNPGNHAERREFMNGDADCIGAFLQGSLRRKESNLDSRYVVDRMSSSNRLKGPKLGARLQAPRLGSGCGKQRCKFMRPVMSAPFFAVRCG